MQDPIALWHEIIETRNFSKLDDLLADNVVFYSPVVFKPQEGKRLTLMYLQAAGYVIANEHFRYVRKIVGTNQACLEFETQIAGLQVNGVDILEWDSSGKVTVFKVMVRPLKGVQAVWQAMAELLQQLGMQRPPE